MRALLVQARSPTTYWSFESTLPIIRRDATYPPLAIATVAALLPAGWELRLRDLNVAPLDDADLAWADAVLVSGLLVQAPSVREVLRRARAMGRRTVVGGAAVSSAPELFEEADHVFLGEAEGRLDLLVRVLESPAGDSPRLLSPEGDERPDLRLARVPRFDLLELSRYGSHALQFSRGCPFRCEFCDIIELFGRVPRVKTPEQILAELDALLALGARGTLFFVDDNFVGNRRAVASLLPALRAWQERNEFPFVFCTEASVDLAMHPELVTAMVDAGFGQVFLGLETPSRAALAEAGKTQNLRMPQERAVEELTRAGLEVYAGFIIGFDSDGPDIFDRQLAFISNLPIARAMVNVLIALPGTRLWRRLEQEGRLRGVTSGDSFERPNFVPALDERTLLAGYRRLLASLYSPDAYLRRCALHLEQAPLRRGAVAHSVGNGSLATLGRAVWRLGIRSPRRMLFWRLVARALRRGTAALPRAVMFAIVGESLIRYTEEVVLPRLDASLSGLDRARAASLVHPRAEGGGVITATQPHSV
ncbi:B12-binding domain-containing radical SAM protein [Anaeromyxobacter sp. Fw109-5]|uniref:B12-binding domain-containing radical SAM protein n=1 Tax=Anaeromyxobacter sp. (strain Fw109-5) TaxID=404589 RepID=UPI0000ED8AA4|nr:B12-binding domain-containing radical SAM protein [Anaeromyxobacter sp. Fw109-5]ABS27378.1 Radical SAM domain protein [Anaeromyxobacter sp. Fw109-5]